ncbi:hypothetical protein BIV23_29210 [Streptomyces monashensis]|uniref:Uncharacterized protein n=1 Tax=Streptomyces monashensis TaxID=1678012 RepID=A0A1S2PYE0_9ACTN|nr:hypothetical protein BIV23_29210 [Streptomyces monashensis]
MPGTQMGRRACTRLAQFVALNCTSPGMAPCNAAELVTGPPLDDDDESLDDDDSSELLLVLVTMVFVLVTIFLVPSYRSFDAAPAIAATMSPATFCRNCGCAPLPRTVALAIDC